MTNTPDDLTEFLRLWETAHVDALANQRAAPHQARWGRAGLRRPMLVAAAVAIVSLSCARAEAPVPQDPPPIAEPAALETA